MNSQIRTPPHTTKAEKAVLGSLLLDNKRYADVTLLTANDFYHQPHRIIWGIATEQLRANHPFDLVVLQNELKRLGKLDYVGGPAALREIADCVPSSKNAEYYAELVKEKSVLRRIAFAIDRWSRDVYVAKEPSKLLEDMEREFTAASQDLHQDGGWEDIESACHRIVDRLNSNVQPISTGLPLLDKRSGGLLPGELVIAAARPSMGKTALLTSILRDLVYTQGHTVALFSLEVGSDRWLSNLACNYGRVNTYKVRDKVMDDQETSRFMTALSYISQFRDRIHFCGTPDISITALRSRARQAARESTGLAVIAVDYLQLMGGDNKRSNRTQEIGVISRGLKKMAAELGVCVLALAQLSRRLEERIDKRPKLSDLRESGSIEQDADQVWFIHRPGYYEQPDKQSAQRYTELIIAKNRNGERGSVRLEFVPKYVRFDHSTEPLRTRPVVHAPHQRSSFGGYMPNG